MTLFVPLVVKSAVLVLAAGFGVLLLRNASAALRHRVWALVFVGLAGLPLLSLRLPTLDVERRGEAPRSAPSRQTTVASAVADGERTTMVATPASPRRTPSLPTKPIPWESLAWSAWQWGALVAVGLQLIRLRAASALVRGGEELSYYPAHGLPPHTRLIRTSAVEVPMTLGFLRPVVLLPSASAEWSPGRLRAILLHEGAHVRRGDWAWLIFAGLVRAAYWPNPLVGWAWHRLRAESERAADDSVLRAGVPAPRYAEALLEMATELRGSYPIAALPFVERATLKVRVRAILQTTRSRAPLSRHAAASAVLLAVALIVPFSAARLVEGPATVRDGILELPTGRLEIVAITEVKDGLSRSWDAHGALLPAPYSIDREATAWFQKADPRTPPDADVRYVVYRVTGDEVPFLFDRLNGDALTTWGYDGRSLKMVGKPYSYYFDTHDAFGGSLRLVRLVVPEGRRAADLYTRFSSAGWAPFAWVTFDEGRPTGLLNPTVRLEGVRAIPGSFAKAEIRFSLPPEFANQEVKVVVSPGKPMVQTFQGTTGDLVASSNVPLDQIRKVELFARPLQSAVFSELPLQPDPSATYRPVRFEPQGLVSAEHGRATLPDGSTLELISVTDGLGRRWRFDGAPVGNEPREAFTLSEPEDRSLRSIRIAFRKTPGGSPSDSEFFDGEGRGLLAIEKTTSWMADGSVRFGFHPLVERNRRRLDLIARMPLGAYQTIGEGRLNVTKGYSSRVLRRPNANPVLRVEFPPSLAPRLEGMDVSLTPLDVRGRPVLRKDGSLSWSRSNDETAIEFELPPDRAKLVRFLRISVRPYGRVRFPGVELYPRP